MRRLREQIEAEVAAIDDPLARIAAAVRTFLAYFAAHPRLRRIDRAGTGTLQGPNQAHLWRVSRAKPGAVWADLYGALIADGRVRAMPPERIAIVIGDLIYGTIFTNYFAGRSTPPDEQAADILNVVFLGILTTSERERLFSDKAGHGP